MLANNVIPTPRPRPPAKARRSFSTKLNPTSESPPRGFRFPSGGGPTRVTMLGSPVSLADQITGWDSQQCCPPAEDSNWINQASREELYDLFTKAGDLIKERESELSTTSAVCRSLYDHNVALRSKHEALLARIPGTPSQSTAPSPMPYMTPSVQSPHYYSDSLPRDSESIDNDISLPPSPIRTRHNRRISVCPLDIALLSDQNAELLDKVEKLESESTQADQMGRRALKKLEKEIQDLREELERTQAKGDELEEKARAGFGISAEKLMDEMWKKKEEREDRLKALKRKSEDLGDGNLEVRNFAPTGALWTATSPSHFPVAKYLDSHKPPTSPPPDINLATKPVSPPVAESCDIGSSSSSVASLPQREYAVVSQLLFKIRELEETNSQIRAQQAATAAKLQAVHRDTRRISKLYECLGDQAGVEWESEDGQTNHSVAHDVIRFQSLKKSLEKDLSDPTADDDVFGVTNNHSTVRGVAALNFNTVKRSRKTVVGLFDTPASESAQQDLENVDTMPSLPLSLLPPADPDTSRMSWLMGITSPALSELSLGTHTLAETSTSGRPGRTLGSELGSEFGDDWALNGENHHLRKTSLYDLSLLSTTQSPSPMPIDLLVTPNAGGLQTPESMTHPIRLEVETPTPKPSKGGGQTNRPRIDGRTNTPVERAVCERLVDASIHTSRPPTPMGLSGASDEITGTSTGGEPGKCSIVRSQSSNEVKETGCLRATVRTKKEGLVAMMLELWLWLQFIIIILVFLWAMAKRGPKSILDGSEHRRARLRQ